MAAAAGFEILDQSQTPLGMLVLRRRDVLGKPGTKVTEVTLDGEFLMSSLNIESESALASRALTWHGGTDLAVLVGGLGLGYTALAALRHPGVRRVEVLELLPDVIGWLEKGHLPMGNILKNDDRFAVAKEDIFERLAASPEWTYDLILIDVDHSPEETLDPRNRAFYRATGLERARRHLSKGGVLAVWSSAESEAFAAALGQTFAEVKVETVEWHNELIDRDQVDYIYLAHG